MNGYARPVSFLSLIGLFIWLRPSQQQRAAIYRSLGDRSLSRATSTSRPGRSFQPRTFCPVFTSCLVRIGRRVACISQAGKSVQPARRAPDPAAQPGRGFSLGCGRLPARHVKVVPLDVPGASSPVPPHTPTPPPFAPPPVLGIILPNPLDRTYVLWYNERRT
jgi:hypothetical protein